MVERMSVITCPEFAIASAQGMPIDARQWFHDSAGCGTALKPLTGDCCVFCSYGSVACPPVQVGRCCSA